MNIQKDLSKAHREYTTAIDKAKRMLSPKIKFPFFIEYQPSDGFVILNEESTRLAPLGYCTLIIESKGELTYEDFLNGTI